MRTKYFGSVLALLSLVAATSATTLITFNQHPNDFNHTMVDSGYTFNTTAAGWGIVRDDYVGIPPFTRNGTTRFMMSGRRNGEKANVFMSESALAPFNLVSFDAATSFDDTRPNTLIVIGHLASGGMIGTEFGVNRTFGEYTLPTGWENLLRVNFMSGTDADYEADPGISLDNILVTPVPEPSALLALGLAVIPLLRRRS